ncbi:50S ribosomal protein L24 [Chryseosolibacter indicus]|uniref:Large ribosomal subunit protein uL24 n=1 Tax=Chryseosolibacter indicus TaxID=2782351 RepID=A0ABS5VKX0_9BACT|nr:50S ribosomal protein L24 [Chryseosolibacter indicus]MBT1702093.1 50S ribosomal protein L24 [Chryseosolibacter indicus]
MQKKNTKQPKLHIKKGDTVKVIAGDDKGKEGKVLDVILDKRRAVVEGVNIHTKHEKPSAGKPEGGIKKVEAPIHVSNLMLVDPASGKTTRVGRKLNDKSKLQRYSKKTGEFIK